MNVLIDDEGGSFGGIGNTLPNLTANEKVLDRVLTRETMAWLLPNRAKFAKQVEQLLGCYVVAVEEDVSDLVAIMNDELQGWFRRRSEPKQSSEMIRYILEVLDEENPAEEEKNG